MRRGRPARSLTCLGLVLLGLVAAGCASAPPVRPTSIASGAAGGVYQPIAEAIARIARESPGLNLPLTVESTGASVANLQLLGAGKVQLALAQNDIAYYAAQGTTLPAFRGKALSNLRAIMSIYPEYVHVVASQASGIVDGGGSPRQAGRARPGGLGNGAERAAGPGGQRTQGDRPRAGGAHRHGGGGDPAPRRASWTPPSSRSARAPALVRDLLGRRARQARPRAPARSPSCAAKLPFYWLDEIPAGTYPGPDRRGLDALAPGPPGDRRRTRRRRRVYGLTKALVDNLPALRAAHPAARDLSTDTMLRVVTVPLHKGALRLYDERKIQQ